MNSRPFTSTVRASRTLAAALVFAAGIANAQLTLTEGTNFSLDVADDRRIVFDLVGALWLLPPGGGAATLLDTGSHDASRPRWSPSGKDIVYEAREAGSGRLWLLHTGTGHTARLGDGRYFDQDGAWHPDGDRLVYSSDRGSTGFDLWEIDLATGLTWRLTNLPGDEIEPAWSADGRNLVYIHRDRDEWALKLKPFGEPDTVLVTARERLAEPSWRPDGSLVAYTRRRGDSVTIDMVILSDPPLERVLVDDGDVFFSRVAWPDRQQLVYAANGVIRSRNFNSWSSRTIRFRASVEAAEAPVAERVAERDIATAPPPAGRRVIRADRLWDGLARGYRSDVDIVVDGATIIAIEASQPRPGVPVVDVGNITVVPGLIDAWSALPDEPPARLGPLLLSFGITTIAAPAPQAQAIAESWDGGALPGPRAIEQSWTGALEAGRAVLLGDESRPASPAGRRYADIRLAAAARPALVLSGIADSATPAIGALLDSRQARLMGSAAPPPRRYDQAPDASGAREIIVAGSQPNGLPPGIGLHAELRALVAAGLTPREALVAAGNNAAAALGLDGRLGTVAVGQPAELVLLDGDPLEDIEDALKVVGVVRNGRFFSTIRLIEIAADAATVE